MCRSLLDRVRSTLDGRADAREHRPPVGRGFVSPWVAVRALSGLFISVSALYGGAFFSVGWYEEVKSLALAGLARVFWGAPLGVRRRGWRSLRFSGPSPLSRDSRSSGQNWNDELEAGPVWARALVEQLTAVGVSVRAGDGESETGA